ncbi:hypothetical protein [Labilibacter marinus]|uniref:hypothetical protein n=1 Tax=Labilibacter marinus TaxID=1477105 RepID=UPI000832C758|nr:hypothetical protein [Labilibacter marinus]
MKKLTLLLITTFLLGNLCGQLSIEDKTINAMFIIDHNSYDLGPNLPISYTVNRDSQGQVVNFTYKCLMLEYLHNDIPNELTFKPKKLKDNSIYYESDGRDTRWSNGFYLSNCNFDQNNKLVSYDERLYLKHPITYFSYDEKGRLSEIKKVHRTMKRKGKKKIVTASWVDAIVSFDYNNSDHITKKEVTFYNKSANEQQLGSIRQRNITDITINNNHYSIKYSENDQSSFYELYLNENLNTDTLLVKSEKNQLIRKYTFKYNNNHQISFKREESYLNGKLEIASEENYTYKLVDPNKKEPYYAFDYAQYVNSLGFNHNNELVREQKNNTIRYVDDNGSWSEWMTYIDGIPDSAQIDYMDRRIATKPVINNEFYSHNLFRTDSVGFICSHILNHNITKKRDEQDQAHVRRVIRTSSRPNSNTKYWHSEYDVHGRLSSKISFGTNFQIIETRTYAYDNMDRCISYKRDYNKNGNKMVDEYNYSYVYDNNRGRTLSKITKNGELERELTIRNDSVFTTTFAQGVTEKIELLGGFQHYIVYEYTSKGNLHDKTEIKDGGNVYSIRYSFKHEGDKEICYLRKEKYSPTEDSPIIEREYDGNNKLTYERIGDSYKRFD